jgi:hypothetical protein
LEWQSKDKCKVLSAKQEHNFNDLGVDVRVWNVKTDNDGDWWVVEGDMVPMNLYPQSAYYFSADKVYSFHMRLMEKMRSSRENYDPEDFVRGVMLDSVIVPQLFRKLKSVASLIELGNHVYMPLMAGNDEQPQAPNFKRKAELSFNFPSQARITLITGE